MLDRFASSPKLAELLEEVRLRAQEAWPSLAIAETQFYPYLAARIAGNKTPTELLEEADVPGLYLACGCGLGDQAALQAFQVLLAPYVRSVGNRMGFSASDAEDLVAALSEQLLFPGGDIEPRIKQYQGRGNLRSWLKVCITRMALRRKSKDKRRSDVHEQAQLLPEDPSDDLLLAYLRRQYRGPFTQAFRDAFRNLCTEDRLLMRRKFVDGLTGDELAALLGVHRATVVRNLTRVRKELVEDIRVRLIQKLQVGADEVDSIIRVLRSQLDASFNSLLGMQSESASR